MACNSFSHLKPDTEKWTRKVKWTYNRFIGNLKCACHKILDTPRYLADKVKL